MPDWKLVSVNWNANSKRAKLASATCTPSRNASSGVPLEKASANLHEKIEQLENLRPGAAAVVESLIDGLLND